MKFEREILAENMRRARKRRGFSQRKLAQLTGLPKSTVYNIESTRFCPRVDTLCMLAETLGVGLDELCYGAAD